MERSGRSQARSRIARISFNAHAIVETRPQHPGGPDMVRVGLPTLDRELRIQFNGEALAVEIENPLPARSCCSMGLAAGRPASRRGAAW